MTCQGPHVGSGRTLEQGSAHGRAQEAQVMPTPIAGSSPQKPAQVRQDQDQDKLAQFFLALFPLLLRYAIVLVRVI